MGMQKDLKPPSQGGLPAKEFEKEHGVSKGKAAQTFKRTIKGMSKGGLPKKNFAKPGSYSKRK